MDRETLINVACTSLRTKVHAELADLLTEVVILKTCYLITITKVILIMIKT